MSKSDLSDAPSPPTPSDLELEQALRKQVRDALRAGQDDALITVSSMRKAAEEALGLEAGFYKNNARWKEESKRIVHEAFDQGADASSPVKAKSQPAKPSTSSKAGASTKRASPDVNGAEKKRRKTRPALSSEEALSSPPSQSDVEEEQKPVAKPKTKKQANKSTTSAEPPKSKKKPKSVSRASESDLSDVHDEAANAANADISDSELSILIDSEPPPKKKKRKDSAPAEKRGKKPPSAPKTKPDTDSDPDAAEIKRLQGWLVKCGIRKLWGKELKPYESPKAKIKHLKDMLADAGMTGRYSLEKANQIKEERELRADIEAVKEGAERWGKEKELKNGEDAGSDSDEDGRGKPKRRLVRGAQAKVLDFLSSEGEETD